MSLSNTPLSKEHILKVGIADPRILKRRCWWWHLF